jgi:hypothetical protein
MREGRGEGRREIRKSESQNRQRVWEAVGQRQTHRHASMSKPGRLLAGQGRLRIPIRSKRAEGERLARLLAEPQRRASAVSRPATRPRACAPLRRRLDGGRPAAEAMTRYRSSTNGKQTRSFKFSSSTVYRSCQSEVSTAHQDF